ncbi:Inner membrane protein translocase component YidC, long form [Actinokineospora spheciospongiae]|uniref:Membrane protein insertase YidC n=1 Tax=Actinokineospora spheciospongiae TaxID=909613 RepID=W7IWH0_9PSEU|nr:membrane protein insertase YidC [Actinokineospora spheciospongiae]EWC58369.1 Inner membrane protein translocase component YidC, long form [Actinokineospora spheciospongiae]PWW61954.1 YidC/Oxa1 family membrane protein insertase [Actinokineospora spheciospongiae]
MLDFIYYPVSFILWCWHWVFGHIFGESSAVAWVLGIVFLVFTLRAIMFKPMVNQVRSMKKMQEFAPEIKKLQKKYANDKQKLAQEMQKLQSQHGVNPLGGCLPMLLQIPVFIGLFHVLHEFKPGKTENYYFDEQGVASYIQADLFGARLGNWITQPAAELANFEVSRSSIILVAIPLLLTASALTHLTARHSVSRQNPESATPQTAIMNKLTLYMFPLGVLVGGFFFPFPIGLILYWLSNNSWTLWQQRFVYKRIDAEEAAAKEAAIAKRSATAPKPGQRPTAPRPGQKPQAKKPTAQPADATTAEAPESDPTKATSAEKPTGTGSTASTGSTGSSAGGTEIPGLISDRSRKKSGRKNR